MTDELVTVASRALAVDPADIEIDVRCFVDSQNNRIYDLYYADRHLILKQYLPSNNNPKGPIREFKALERLQSTGIAPLPVFYDPDLGPYVFYEFMEGEHWNRRTPSHKEMNLLCESVAALHALDTDGMWASSNHEQTLRGLAARIGDGFSDYVDWTAHHFPAANDVAQYLLDSLSTVDRVLEKLDDLEPVLGFCRGDPRFANILTQPNGKVGFVDWEDAGLQDCAFELADLMMHVNQEDIVPVDAWEAFTDRYIELTGGDDPSLRQRLDGYRTVCAFWWLARLLWVGIGRDREDRLNTWMINGVEPNQRLNRYLMHVDGANRKAGAAQFGSGSDVVFFPQ